MRCLRRLFVRPSPHYFIKVPPRPRCCFICTHGDCSSTLLCRLALSTVAGSAALFAVALGGHYLLTRLGLAANLPAFSAAFKTAFATDLRQIISHFFGNALHLGTTQ